MKYFLLLALLAPVLSFAQSPFDGTWVTKLDSAQFPKQPDSYLVAQGMYHCLTCTPKVDAEADGSEQKVTGHSYYDTIVVKVVDPNTVEVTNKKAGKTTYTETDVVSADGKTLTQKFSDQSEDKPVTGEITFTRVKKGPPGSHAFSGSWRVEKVNAVSSNGLLVTYQGTADGLKMSDQNGVSYDAKFDGKEYPVQGDIGDTLVSLKKIDAHTIEETDKREGQVVSTTRMSVTPDGRSIRAVYTDTRRKTTTTFTMEKQM
jgi:hypothetical protein